MPQTVAQGADVIADLGDTYADTMDTVISDQLADISQAVGDTSMNVSGIRGLLASILATITTFFDNIFDISAFQLDFDGFKNLILVDRFPFCIPFDLVNCVSAFAHNASNFTFDIELHTAFFDIDHTVDLSPFVFYFGFFRYVATIWFTILLINKTKSMIKW